MAASIRSRYFFTPFRQIKWLIIITELDVNLTKQSDLYDVNVVGSLLKTWLRTLPDEIFPQATQNRIAAAHPDAKTVPQMLKDELSQLPPWDYYLLFAFTCHLHLLGEYVEVNKMTYNNLLTCLQPSLKIDHYCFKFLVNQWRECWQGCWTEKQFRDEEYQFLAGLPPDSRDGASRAGPGIPKEPFLTTEQMNALPRDPVDRERPNLGPMPKKKGTNMLEPNEDDATSRNSEINNQAGYIWTPPGGARTRANKSEPDDGTAMPQDSNINNQAGNIWTSSGAARKRANISEPGNGHATPTQNGKGRANGPNGSELPEFTFSPIRFSHGST